MPATLHEAKALVIDCRDQGESDKIVSFFCQGVGRLTAIAKGGNRSKRRFMNKLELFSSLSIVYREGRGESLAFLAEADLLDSFLNLRQNLSLYSAASVIREACLLATREREGDDGLYILSLWGLQALDHRAPHLTILCLFLVRFFTAIGYAPNLDGCSHCHHPIREGIEYGFHGGLGGIICPECRDEIHSPLLPLSAGTLKILQSAQTLPFDRLRRLRLSPAALGEALPVLQQYGRRLFQREINSLRYVASL